jgi:hypothetical protein
MNEGQYVIIFRYKNKSVDEIDKLATANYQINYFTSGKIGYESYTYLIIKNCCIRL